MGELTRFSVVIPAYNAAETIVSSIESCLAQTYAPHEIIVVNDGSTDETQTILESYFGQSIRLIRLPENSGPSAARNTGVAAATGTHIAFQDADDTWHREKLFHIAALLQQHPGMAFLFHPYTLSELRFPITGGMLEVRRYPLWKLLLSNPIGTPCVIIRRDRMLPFKENLQHMEDYELFLREASSYGVFRVAAPFTRVGRPILSEGGQSSRRWRMRMGEIKAWWSFAMFKPVFLPALLPLIAFAMMKHLVKSFFPPRTNY